MKNLLIIILITISLMTLKACNPCKEDFRLEKDFVIGFSLFDKQSGDNLLEIASFYHRDSVKIYNGHGDVIFPGPVSGNGRVYFAPYYFSNAFIPISKDTTEYYYLHLIKNGIDIDTFRIDYRVSLDECSEKKFTNLTFYYNEELVFSDDQERFDFYIDLYK